MAVYPVVRHEFAADPAYCCGVQRWFVTGVVAAGLVLVLVLPLGVGAEGFPTLVDCRFRSGQARCQAHVTGVYPAASALYRLQAEVSSSHGHALSLSQLVPPGMPGDTWPQGAVILCLRPGRSVFSCLRTEGGQPVFQGAPNMLGMYVDAQGVPPPGP
jgi:hypothetical protein